MFTLHRGLKKLISQRGKDNPILTMSDEIGADAHLYRQTVCSHNIGNGQTLLSARPTVTFPALPLFGRYQIIQLRNRHACKQLAQSCYMKVERFRIMDKRNRFFKFQFGFGSVLKKPGFGLDWVRFGLKNAVPIGYYSYLLLTYLNIQHYCYVKWTVHTTLWYCR